MKEVVLRHFFEGHATAQELAADLVGTRDPGEPFGFRSSANYAVVPMASEFSVTSAHVVRLVDAALAGDLSESDLGTLIFCMEAGTERWHWDTDTTDGERVAEALFWLGTPEVNYPLTPSVLAKVRHYLVTGENTLADRDAEPLGGEAAV